MVRHKNRYIVVEINTPKKPHLSLLKLKDSAIYASILRQIQKQYGDFGVAAIRAGFLVKYVNEHTRVGIIRCRRGPHSFVSSVLPLINNIENISVVVNILYVGATIAKSFLFLRNYQQKKFDEYCVCLKTDEEKNLLKQAMLNFDRILAKL